MTFRVNLLFAFLWTIFAVLFIAYLFICYCYCYCRYCVRVLIGLFPPSAAGNFLSAWFRRAHDRLSYFDQPRPRHLRPEKTPPRDGGVPFPFSPPSRRKPRRRPRSPNPGTPGLSGHRRPGRRPAPPRLGLAAPVRPRCGRGFYLTPGAEAGRSFPRSGADPGYDASSSLAFDPTCRFIAAISRDLRAALSAQRPGRLRSHHALATRMKATSASWNRPAPRAFARWSPAFRQSIACRSRRREMATPADLPGRRDKLAAARRNVLFGLPPKARSLNPSPRAVSR